MVIYCAVQEVQTGITNCQWSAQVLRIDSESEETQEVNWEVLVELSTDGQESIADREDGERLP